MNSARRVFMFFIFIFLLNSLCATCGSSCGGCYCCSQNNAYSMTHFSQRPQGNNQAWVLMGTVDKTHRVDNDETYLLVDVALGYRRNFDAFELGKYFFTQYGPLVVGVVNTSIDVQNQHVGLAQNFQGNAVLNPCVSEFIADLDFFAGLDHWVQGAWARVRFPFVRSCWSSCIQSYTSQPGAPNYLDGLTAPSGITVPVVYRDIAYALNDSTGFGQIPALCAGRICPCAQTRWGLSDIHFEIGYDFYRFSRGNVGVALIGAIPTGVPSANENNTYIIAPMIGSQCCGQVGILLRGQYELFHAKNEKKITLYGDVRLLHLTQAINKRLLSFNVGNTTAFNYWLLLNHYDSAGNFLGAERAANILNRRVYVSADMLELTAIAQMRKEHVDLTAGYNFWWRSKESVCPQNTQISTSSDYYALKDVDDNPSWNEYIADKATTNIAYQQTAVAATLENIKRHALYSGNLDVCCAQHPRTYSSTFFGYVGYNFVERALTPHVGAGILAEFGCGNTALSMVGFFVKGNVSF